MIYDEIQNTSKVLREFPSVKTWLEQSNLNAGDLIVINNSFVYRQKLKTVKNEKYLALRVSDEGRISDEPVIVTGITLKSDIKLVKEVTSLNVSPIDEAIATELPRLGRLVFILIGEVKDNVLISEGLNHSAFEHVQLDPMHENLVEVYADHILINDTYDEEAIWQATCDFLINTGRGEEVNEALRTAIGVALDKLEEEAYASLQIPDEKTSEESISNSIVEVLQEQVDRYEDALQRSQGDPAIDNKAFNELLRVAYNFASDATTYIRLIVSICDLKPVILWGTIGQHYKLSEAFRALPWLRSRNKPSLSNYINTIGDARNAAFHNLFPFRKSLDVQLPEASLEGLSLRIFSQHGKKSENQLLYQDKELVEVLTELTRAGERRVAPRFRQKNLEVMNATIELFEKTGNFLGALLGEID